MMDVQPFTFNELLVRSDINPTDVLIMRHRPHETKLNLIFDSIASEHPDLFNCYQSTHAPRTEAALKKAKYLASFIRHLPGSAIFIGLYEVRGFQIRTADEIMARPMHQKLVELGMSGDFTALQSGMIAEFHLKRTDWAGIWAEKMVIQWPGADRAWYQWAERNTFEITAIAESSLLSKAVPSWQEMTPTWPELQYLPRRWHAALRHWRGIYLITDTQGGRHYVGSAAGQENLLQRWMNYADTGHGGNKHLKSRQPENFRFSILQRLSPDAELREVVALENSWKERLSTRYPNGLNEN